MHVQNSKECSTIWEESYFLLHCTTHTVAQHVLDVGVAGVDGEDKEESNAGGDEGGDQEVEDGPDGDPAAHLCIETGRAGDEAGDDQREDHELEKSHEELSWVGDKMDGREIKVQVTKGEAAKNT